MDHLGSDQGGIWPICLILLPQESQVAGKAGGRKQVGLDRRTQAKSDSSNSFWYFTMQWGDCSPQQCYSKLWRMGTVELVASKLQKIKKWNVDCLIWWIYTVYVCWNIILYSKCILIKSKYESQATWRNRAGTNNIEEKYVSIIVGKSIHITFKIDPSLHSWKDSKCRFVSGNLELSNQLLP